MSKVISFRLDADNPREAQAIDVLHAWITVGHSVRYTLTEALLKLEYPEPIQSENASLGELTKTLGQINKLLEQLGGTGSLQTSKSDKVAETGLTSAFIESVKVIAKPGLRKT